MTTLPCLLLLCIACGGVVPAQGFAAKIASAEQLLAEHRRAAALACLQALASEADIGADRDQVADVAEKLSDLCAAEGDLGTGLAACKLVLGLRTRADGGDRPENARALVSLGYFLNVQGQAEQALSRWEAALAMVQRIGNADEQSVASLLDLMAANLRARGLTREALVRLEQRQELLESVHAGADDLAVAANQDNLAVCLHDLGRMDEAIRAFESSLAMRRRLLGNKDHEAIAGSLYKLGTCQHAAGHSQEALPLLEASLAMRQRLFGGVHAAVAASMNSLAACLDALGRHREALPMCEATLAMRRQLFGDSDQPDIAVTLNQLGAMLQELGRYQDALPRLEEALAMQRRLFGDRDRPLTALALHNVASCLNTVGRSAEALIRYEAALAMSRRLFADQDHPQLASTYNSVALCLDKLERSREALPLHETALSMRERLSNGHDQSSVAESLNNLAFCLVALHREQEALPKVEAALAMRQRLFGGRDHVDLVYGINAVGRVLSAVGRQEDALGQYERALAMNLRLWGERDHPLTAVSYRHVAECLVALDRPAQALLRLQQAVDIVERLRTESRTLSPQFQQSYFEEMKRGGVFESLQRLQVALGRPADALFTAERSRGRQLQDLLEQQTQDPLAEVEARARASGDDTEAGKIGALRRDLTAALQEDDRLLFELARADAAVGTEQERAARRSQLVEQSSAVQQRLREIMGERARRVADLVPAAGVRTAPELQATLAADECLLVFTLDREGCLLYVVAGGGDAVQAHRLPAATEQLAAGLASWIRGVAREGQLGTRGPVPGRDPDATTTAPAEIGRALFAALIPEPVWQLVRTKRHLFVAAHRWLHRLPFALLVTDTREGKPVYWLDSGPPVAYVPSGSALQWLRARATGPREAADGLHLLAIGDPGPSLSSGDAPDEGAFVAEVVAGGPGERIGLRVRDILRRYDDQPVADSIALGTLQRGTEAAIVDGTRARTPIPIEVWRAGEILRLLSPHGRLGIQVTPGNPRLAWQGSLGRDAEMRAIQRHGDLERMQRLPPLVGAKAEVEAITRSWIDAGRKATLLLGSEATETAVFELAAQATYLHFACHGIAEEYAGQSLSMLVLCPPKDVQTGDDGLLKLGDLLQKWHGRLRHCELVVLSACRTNVGPTLRDEVPQALSIGFLLAGAPSVISSHWAVDDASTRDLMTEFYQRLLAGETDKLAAFTAATKALRTKHPDPFHWAPFLYIGMP